jgi:hypothetical protein
MALQQALPQTAERCAQETHDFDAAGKIDMRESDALALRAHATGDDADVAPPLKRLFRDHGFDGFDCLLDFGDLPDPVPRHGL